MTSIYYENDPKEMRYTCDLVCVALEEMGAGIEIREIFKKLFQTPTILNLQILKNLQLILKMAT